MTAPQWTNRISDSLICNWFYFFYAVAAALSAVVLVAILYLVVQTGGSLKGQGFSIFMLMIQLGITTTSTLFYYLLCDRALKPVAGA